MMLWNVQRRVLVGQFGRDPIGLVRVFVNKRNGKVNHRAVGRHVFSEIGYVEIVLLLVGNVQINFGSTIGPTALAVRWMVDKANLGHGLLAIVEQILDLTRIDTNDAP
jgi:hypothetical protein